MIAPNVFRDGFFDAIRSLARVAPIDTVLEIGASPGDGSTLAWVEGLRGNPRLPKLCCLERSRERHEAQKQRWSREGFVKCFWGASVALDQFPTEADLTHSYHSTVESPLHRHPLEEVLLRLREDKARIQREQSHTGLIREIKQTLGIEHFGAVLIDGSEFTGNAELDEVYGAEYLLLGGTQTYKCHEAYHRLLRDPGYELIMENAKLREGHAIFRRRHRASFDPLPPEAPVHYFTIVLNGEPFIRHHVAVLKQLSFRWHWHVVEGAAALTHDTGWSLAAGGHLPEAHHRNGLSIDGTSAYLDELAALHPGQITIYRPPAVRIWDGKIEMVSEPLRHIFEDGILWEIDADELWTVEQLEEGRKMFLEHPEKNAAMFWCDFFVGENLVVSSRHCYSQNPAQDWLRAWRFRPGMRWLKHEPPTLCSLHSDGTWTNVAAGRVFTHAETEARGLVFQHFAYVTEAQVAFKEHYYGYAGAVESWRRLQQTRQFPALLRDAFPWVTDHTGVDTVASRHITPLAQRDDSGVWQFSSRPRPRNPERRTSPTIVVDGIFFQLNNTGIARLWLELLKQWVASGVSKNVWVLDRDGSCPRVEGIQYHRIGRFDVTNPGPDAFVLQDTCDLLGADVFISTYYTYPVRTPCIGMLYDMIPERLNLPAGDWQWEQKKQYILQSQHFVCISQSTAHDLQCLYPEVTASDVTVIYPAAPPEYTPASASAITAFREEHGLKKDYIMLCGERMGIPVGSQGYKNASLAFRAWSLLPREERESLMIVCTGGKPDLEESLRLLAPQAEVRVIRFSEEELALAFSGAEALVYPSLYEGFGLPVIEAMACECPVITCRRASLTEVAGDAALFVDPWDAQETATAIMALRNDTALRSRLTTAGLAQAARFDFQKAAASVAKVLFDAASQPAPAEESRLARSWKSLRRALAEQSALGGSSVQLHEQLQLATAMGASLKATQVALLQTQEELAAAKKALGEKQHTLKEVKTTLQEVKSARKKTERKLRDIQEKRKSPLKRLWNRLRRGENS